MFLAFRICARPIFSPPAPRLRQAGKKERTFFFLVFCPRSFWAGIGASTRKQKVAGGWGEGHFLLTRPNSNGLTEILKNDKIIVMNIS